MMRSCFFIVLILLATRLTSCAQVPAVPSVSQTTPFVLGVIQQVHSDQLGENRLLNIYLPEGYSSDSTTTYPVIYLLDGSANEDFIHIVGLVQFLTMIGVMPKSIVVGIANVDRRRDFTYPTTIAKDKKDFPTTGGSAPFMAFLEKELQPFIRSGYRTSGVKTLIGQSLGGLLATEILLHHPDLFDNYIIVSPSLWWDNESLLTALKSQNKQSIMKPTNVYVSVGNEGKQMENDAQTLADLLQRTNPSNLTVQYVYLPDENHLTILHRSVYRAFELFYPKKK
ncbi:alpha/beta hydrolase-fold protein [Spirosoma sp. SC4-14]|uniref:alpha/beta hydrolase n=1 Tax=Spirosoma sp. SC4-14 TaxID=3128900 RepID=UPI0030D621F2